MARRHNECAAAQEDTLHVTARQRRRRHRGARARGYRRGSFYSGFLVLQIRGARGPVLGEREFSGGRQSHILD